VTQLSGAIHQESKVDKFVFYPYKFGSIFKEKVWGGRGLNLFLHKDLPPHAMVGESWELSDRDADMSIVENGPHRGVSLRSLMTANPASLLGEDVARAFPHRFPLLVKYIDAHETLSLQVHPDDAHAMRNENGQWGKMEAWYIIHAAPGAFIYRGVVPGTDRRRFEDMLLRRTVRDCLVKLPVNTGDLVFVPPGCLHATGRGVLFCEVQQNSDLTYRVYDWDRVDTSGNGRELHVEKALDVVDWDLTSREELTPPPIPHTNNGSVQVMLRCPKFEIDKVTLKAGEKLAGSVERRFHVLCIVDGHARITCPAADATPAHASTGETYLIPSAAGSYELASDDACTALRAFVPLKEDG